MKKLIFTTCVSLIGVFASAQLGPPVPVKISEDAVTYLPQYASGFLILNKFKHESVSKWIVKVQTRSYDSIAQDYQYEIVENIILNNKYFTRLDEYGDGSYFLSITGQNAEGVDVVQQGPLSFNSEGETMYNDCGWQCIGATYAYGLELWVNYQNSSSRIQMTNARPPAGSLHHYQWMSPADFGIMSSNTNQLSYYGLSSWLFSENGNDANIIRLENISQQNAKKNKDGVDVYGTVYGVKKDYGPWKPSFSMTESNIISSGNDNCIQSFDWAMNMVNTGDYIDANPSNSLSCDGIASGDGDPNPGTGEILSGTYNLCWEIITGTYDQNTGNFVETLTSSSSCFFNGVGNGDGGYSWPEDIAIITLNRFDNDGSKDPIVLNEASLFDKRGDYIGDPIRLSKGLYYVGIQYVDGSYGSAFFESKTNTISNITKSKFLTVNAFPVPIVHNQFTLELNAKNNLKVNYLILNSDNQVVFRKRYSLVKGSDIKDLITLPSQTASGILYNKLLFEDGSEITFQTIK